MQITQFGYACVLLSGGGKATAAAEQANTAYLLEGDIFHPCDAFIPPPRRVRLLLPVGGPWLKIGEAIDYLRAVEPELAIPIHRAGLAPVHQELHHQLIRNLAPAQHQVEVLEHGAPHTL
jgi:L-ascorbate metabolism protein UlaG (beta-lactamase superfamily)